VLPATRAERDEMNIIDYIQTGKANAISRQQLSDLTGLSDREVRRLIEAARQHHAICNLQDGKGYFMASNIQEALAFVNIQNSRGRAVFDATAGAREFIRHYDNISFDG